MVKGSAEKAEPFYFIFSSYFVWKEQVMVVMKKVLPNKGE